MSTSSGRGQFKCPGPRSVRLPKIAVIKRVLALEKNYVWEHGRTFILTSVIMDRVPCAGATLRPRLSHNLSVLVKGPLNRERQRRLLQETYAYRLTEACQRDTKPMLCSGCSGVRGAEAANDLPGLPLARSLWCVSALPRGTLRSGTIRSGQTAEQPRGTARAAFSPLDAGASPRLTVLRGPAPCCRHPNSRARRACVSTARGIRFAAAWRLAKGSPADVPAFSSLPI